MVVGNKMDISLSSIFYSPCILSRPTQVGCKLFLGGSWETLAPELFVYRRFGLITA